MNKMKNIFLIIILILSFSIKIFAESGFVAKLQVPVGLSVCIADGLVLGEPLNKLGINTGVNTKLGYIFDLGKIGITPLLELGYSYDTYGASAFSEAKIQDSILKNSLNLYLKTHSIQIGVMPEINIENFAIGIGFGVKIPLAAEYEYSRLIIQYDGEKKEDIKEKLSRKDIENDYSKSPIPYVKLNFDYNFFFTEKFALSLGVYLGYDFGLPLKEASQDVRLDSLDITAQVGVRFGNGNMNKKDEKPRYGF
ncbi:hypothetical protein BFL38_13505 [Brachyspira hampsonii]|uniref:Outer membrane protein beta-barrel domain-containing protein n=1 Tax=Brachyspira hampsonii TaxID=1287055 RepID=A0A1E5NGM7_9SPIR|nr:hypothetical protein [Brachyspira hampsonii]OEJ15311.1 hypothetical protein BFL38_13505 [Brachyspira hampsonii]